MKDKGLVILGVVILFIIIIAGSGIGKYNTIVDKEELVSTKQADIDAALQRRADLIPNLVNTVKGYASHEQKIIDSVTTARQNLINAKSTEDKIKANEKLTTAVDALMVVVENYPDLKANTVFINLQDELSGTENRITRTRTDYNAAVKEYNSLIKKFPASIIARMFNFEQKEYFEATEGSEIVPDVNFE